MSQCTSQLGGGRKSLRADYLGGEHSVLASICLCSNSPPSPVGSIPVGCLLKPYPSSAWLLSQLLTGAFPAPRAGTIPPELCLKNSGWQAAACPPTVGLTSFSDHASHLPTLLGSARTQESELKPRPVQKLHECL